MAGDRLRLVVGHPRSGTTILGRILGSHPDVCYWEEPWFGRILCQLHNDLSNIYRHGWHDAQLQPDEISRPGPLRQFDIGSPPDHVMRAATESISALAEALLDHLSHESGCELILDKNPLLVTRLESLNELLPGLRAVHIVRDPRAITASAQRLVEKNGARPKWVHSQADSLAEACATDWVERVSSGLEAEEVLGSARVRLVRYEDLLADPVVICRDLADFAGIGWHPRMEAMIRTHNGVGIVPARATRWHEEVSAADADAIVQIAEPIMRRLEYSGGRGN